jgi:hypothetical protein
MPEEAAKILSYAAFLGVVLFGIYFIAPVFLPRPPQPRIIRMMPPPRPPMPPTPPMIIRVPVPVFIRPPGRPVPLYVPRYPYGYQGVR